MKGLLKKAIVGVLGLRAHRLGALRAARAQNSRRTYLYASNFSLTAALPSDLFEQPLKINSKMSASIDSDWILTLLLSVALAGHFGLFPSGEKLVNLDKGKRQQRN